MKTRSQLVCLLFAGVLWAFPATAQSIQASQFKGLVEMEQACAAMPGGRCEILISTTQVITLDHSHTLPQGITLRFKDGGGWIVNGQPLTVGSGIVEGPISRQIFGGTGQILGLRNARPEWFVPQATIYPAAALAAAYRATVLWGTVLLNDATYVSPFYDASKQDSCNGAVAPYVSPRRFLGVSRPDVDDESKPTELVGGTIIRGEICGSAPLQAAHLGVDAGPLVVKTLYKGVKSNGIYLPNHGSFNPKRGTHLADVSVLTNDLDGEHSVLIEGEEEALLEGLWIWTPGGTHGLVLKSAHSVVRDFHCKGASSDCLLVKSDYKTAANGLASDDRLDDIHISYLAKPGDTGGIVMDARWDSVQRIALSNVYEDGTSFGFRGAGSWFYKLKDLTIEGWTGSQITGPCMEFIYSSDIRMVRSSCNGKPATAVISPQRDWVGEIKPHLRIAWTTLVTRLSLALHMP
jgi:hypothetical protein